MNEQELIDNPEALLALIQQAVQQLIEQRPDTTEQEAQLRAVAKAIEQLEKQQISVPDSLRQTKMTLVDQIGQYAQFNRRLRELGDGLTEVLDMIESTIGQPQEAKIKKNVTQHLHRQSVTGQPTTPRSTLRAYIIQALTEFGGIAHTSDVIERVKEMLENKLTPRDMQLRKNGQIVWQHNTHWERQAMVNEGILRNNSQHGYWELAEKQP